eukprot:TRINITY_DN371_c0_g1_i1.p1 TRINITY_DN371_c0_g1~~TRINITY_DN371_c0_g1_i1.p1  ORF type:complete len:257 (-),score=42.37 TRINITY_DN371_c0_g1_i1:36-806(-)
MTGRLFNKVIVLTGAGGAIGRQIALTCADHGAILALSDTNTTTGNETLKLLHSKGHEKKSSFSTVDVSKEEEVKKWIDSVIAEFKTIDVLINNAAVFVFGTVEDVTEKEWDLAFSVNIKGYAFCAKHVVPHMRKNKKGSIINLGSISSFIAQPGFVPYNATKGAVLQLTRCLALDLGSDEIRVNTICPGTIDTPATRKAHPELSEEELVSRACDKQFIKRMGTVQDVANAIVFFASDESSFVTGSYLLVDGGRTAQ